MASNLVDAAAEATEELMEKYLGGEELSEEEIKAGLRQRVLANEIILVTCGSAFKTKVFKQCLMRLLNTYQHRLIFQQSKVSIQMKLKVNVTQAMMSRSLH